MQWPVCHYLPPEASSAEIARAFTALHDSLRSMFERIDGSNLSTAITGEGLAFTTATREVPKKLLVTIADTTKAAYVRTKMDVHGKARGIEVHVDADDADDGKFCVCNSDTPDVQRISIDPDLSTDANPGVLIKTPTGAMTLDTGGAFDWIVKRNGTEGLRLDGTGLLATASIRPNATNTRDLGTSALAWREIFARSIDTDGEQTLVIQRNNVTQLEFDGTLISSTRNVALGSGNLQLPQAAASPGGTGQVWIDTDDDTMHFTEPSTENDVQVEDRRSKDAASGYAGLDASSRVTANILSANVFATTEAKLPTAAPGTPADGHVWMDGSSLFWRDGSTTYAVEGTPV